MKENDFFYCIPSQISSMLLVNQTIKEINLSDCRLGNKLAITLIDGLITNDSLTHLSLRSNQIEDYPVELLAQVLSNELYKLKHLDLAYNFITDFGGVALAKSLSINQNLGYLNLKSNYLQDEAAQSFIQNLKLSPLKNIKKLNLNNNFIALRLLEMVKLEISENLKH